jgi:hypothetical protein
VTLVAYQQALCDLVASPQLCLRLRREPESALAGYDLSEKERTRLETVVRQPGMSTSCTLYRVNRMTPIYGYLPLTCLVLGDELVHEAERFWGEAPSDDREFRHEPERFARFLEQRVESGAVADPYLLEVLRFELAVNRLHVATRTEDDPLTAVVHFDHEPIVLLGCLADRKRPDPEPTRGEFFVLLDATDGEIRLSEGEPALAQRLLAQ